MLFTTKKVLGIIVLIFALAACQSKTQPHNVGNATDYVNFEQQSVFYTQSAFNEAVRASKIGQTRSTAVVPLYFDENGMLITAAVFNEMLDANKLEQIINKVAYTDFHTFTQVLQTGDTISTQSFNATNLTEDYVWEMNNLAVQGVDLQEQTATISNDKAIFVFDPYEEKHQTYSEVMEELAQQRITPKSVFNSPTISPLSNRSNKCTNSLWIGDVVVRKTNGIGVGRFAGHSGVVSRLNTGRQRGGSTCSSGTYTIEATGYHLSWEKHKDFQERSITNAFDPRSRREVRFAYLPNITYQQQRQIVNFHRDMVRRNNNGSLIYDITWNAQNSNPYSIPTMHCSLLNWFGYKQIGVDIDGNGGALVKPYDLITGSSPMQVYHAAYN